MDNQGFQSLAEVLVSPHSQARILDDINAGRAKRVAMILVNAGYNVDTGVGRNPVVPGLLKVLNTVNSAPIDAITARAKANLHDLVDKLKNTAASAARPAGIRHAARLQHFPQFRPIHA